MKNIFTLVSSKLQIKERKILNFFLTLFVPILFFFYVAKSNKI